MDSPTEFGCITLKKRVILTGKLFTWASGESLALSSKTEFQLLFYKNKTVRIITDYYSYSRLVYNNRVEK